MTMICDHAEICRSGPVKHDCPHDTKHELLPDCARPCYHCGEAAGCHETSAPVEAKAHEPDYKRMWERLDTDLYSLEEHGVRTIDPILVRRFMSYIQQTEVKQ